ncbi:hypothetical protein BJY52DRAFT_946770 [Lactarius psammicola]|nr:hypothetical protein BJY52DRAFT_946770 [Lactarius psammicola]
MSDTCPFHETFSCQVDPELYDYLEKHFCLCVELHRVSLEQRLDTGNSSSTLVTSPGATSSSSGYICQSPTCLTRFRRWQDRDRHLLSHLPHRIHCPLLDCQWRGNRVNVFVKHWETNHSGQPGGTPGPSEFIVYDTKVFVNLINNGIISVDVAGKCALDLVHMKANQLRKLSLSSNPWGHRSNGA